MIELQAKGFAVLINLGDGAPETIDDQRGEAFRTSPLLLLCPSASAVKHTLKIGRGPKVFIKDVFKLILQCWPVEQEAAVG